MVLFICYSIATLGNLICFILNLVLKDKLSYLNLICFSAMLFCCIFSFISWREKWKNRYIGDDRDPEVKKKIEKLKKR